MKDAQRRWYVLTGAPGSGKSTLIHALAERGYATFAETGRLLIDHDLKNGRTLQDIHVDSLEFEQRFVINQLEREVSQDSSQLIFFDRGVIDTIPFHTYYKWSLSAQIKKSCKDAVYNPTVFMLDLLEYTQDYGRIESYKTSQGIQNLTARAYEELGYEVVKVPIMPIEERTNFILDYLGLPKVMSRRYTKG